MLLIACYNTATVALHSGEALPRYVIGPRSAMERSSHSGCKKRLSSSAIAFSFPLSVRYRVFGGEFSENLLFETVLIC
jgi:hypothetical protein